MPFPNHCQVVGTILRDFCLRFFCPVVGILTQNSPWLARLYYPAKLWHISPPGTRSLFSPPPPTLSRVPCPESWPGSISTHPNLRHLDLGNESFLESLLTLHWHLPVSFLLALAQFNTDSGESCIPQRGPIIKAPTLPVSISSPSPQPQTEIPICPKVKVPKASPILTVCPTIW